ASRRPERALCRHQGADLPRPWPPLSDRRDERPGRDRSARSGRGRGGDDHMRIHLVSEHANPLAAVGGVDSGGQNVHVAALAVALAERGHEITVYTRRVSEDEPERVEMAPGVTVEHVPAGPAVPLPKDELLPYMPAFGEHLIRRWTLERPDVAHAHFWMSGVATRIAAARHGVPIVQTFHALG